MNEMTPNWYAVRTLSNFERKANDLLVKKLFNTFYPTILKWSRRKDRKKKIEKPMFPGYLFVKTAPINEDLLRILKTDGVIKILGNKNGPLSIPEEQIESVQKVIEAGMEPVIHPYLKIGDMVEVVDGPLRGAVGIYKEINSKKGALIISIDLLGRSILVEVDNSVVDKY